MQGANTASFDVVLGFDMETDIGSYTTYYDGVRKGTDPVLGILKKHNIPATFYWTGHAAMHNPEWVKKVKEAGKLLEIALLDHLILLPGGDYFSFADEGLL